MSNGTSPLVTRLVQDLLALLKLRPDLDLESLDHATPEMDFPLDTARDDVPIHDRSGSSIFVTKTTGVAYIRTKPKGAKYQLRLGANSLPFKNLYLTNTAQSGKSISIIIGYDPLVNFAVSHSLMKMLNVGDSEINPATEDTLGLIQSALDLPSSQLAFSIRSTVMVDETDYEIADSEEYQFIYQTGIGFLKECLVRSPNQNFSLKLNVNGVIILNRTYAEFTSLSHNVSDLTAFAERDLAGVLTGKYVLHLKNIPFKTYIDVRVTNNSGGIITFNNLYGKCLTT